MVQQSDKKKQKGEQDEKAIFIDVHLRIMCSTFVGTGIG